MGELYQQWGKNICNSRGDCKSLNEYEIFYIHCVPMTNETNIDKQGQLDCCKNEEKKENKFENNKKKSNIPREPFLPSLSLSSIRVIFSH